MKKGIILCALFYMEFLLGLFVGYRHCPHKLYSNSETHYVVCMGSSTEIVSKSRFEDLARQNLICSAYEIDVDGLVEVDWNEDATRVWRR